MKTVVSLFGLSPRFIGGSETYARELSQQLGAQGWKSVLCFLDPPTEDVRRYLDLPNVSIEVIEGAVNPGLPALRKVARVLRAYRPEIFHMQFVGFLGLYPWLAWVLGVGQVLFTDQGSHEPDYIPQVAPWWKRKAVRLINWPLSRVFCISKYNYDCFATIDTFPMTRFEVLYNSADFSRVSEGQERRRRFRTNHGIPEGRTVIVQVSWVIPEKGIIDLLEAMRLVLEQHEQAHLVLVGDGPYREQYSALAQQLGLGDHTTWTGLVTDPFSEGVYDGADVVCQVSRWQEGFGQVIAEAMACGKPVIGTRVGAIPEVIEDGKSGFVVERGDVKAIADRILLLLSDQQLRSRMGDNGSAIARVKFDLKQNVKRLLSFYEI
jgi:glycosyltransferase involved in cell wall biosynthesis